MELLQLRYFYESALNENFAKTAEKYMVPATSVSASVRRLEKELGCELFDRSCNRIRLNDNGRRLKQSLSVIFSELDQTVGSLTSVTADNRKIKMLVRAMRGEITNHIVEYQTKHPHIAFKTVFDFDDKNLENYDIIIDEESDRYTEYDKIHLYTTRLRLRVSKNSCLCKKKLTLEQLADQPFVSIGENNGMHKILMNACKRAGFVPNVVVQCNDLYCNHKLIEAGIGIGLGREYPRSTTSGSIEYLDVSDLNETQTIYAYYKKQAAYGNVEHFLNFLKNKVLKDLQLD